MHINPPADRNPDFFKGEPNDITLTLIAYILSRFHLAEYPAYEDMVPPYTLDEEEIQ
jgi:hypothetical protein